MKRIDRTFIRFAMVGVVNTIFGTLIMFLLYNIFRLNYWVSSASNYIFGSILSYFLNKRFTFRNAEKSFAIIIRFAVNISLCYLLAYGIAKPAAQVILSGQEVTVQENGAMLVGMMLFVVINYFGQKMFVFVEK